MAQVIKNIFSFQGRNRTIDFTLIAFRMCSSSLRCQRNEPKNHSNGSYRKRPNVTTNKIFTAPYISNDLRMELGKYSDKGTRFFRLVFTLLNTFYFLYSVLSSTFKILMANLRSAYICTIRPTIRIVGNM